MPDSAPLLHYRQLGQSGPVLVFLHGLYGSGRNLQNIARDLAQDYQVYLLDLRNHGQSFHSDLWDYPHMAEDVHVLMQSLGIQSFALIGHSMGGKVAMQYALDYGHHLSHLVVLDVAPKSYAAAYHQTLLQSLAAVNLSAVSSREALSQQLSAEIPQKDVRDFLLSNLRQYTQSDAAHTGWHWQFNLPILQAQVENITGEMSAPALSFDDCPVLFLAGAESDYILPEDLGLIQRYFPQAHCHWIAHAGHWVHVDQAPTVIARIRDFLK